MKRLILAVAASVAMSAAVQPASAGPREELGKNVMVEVGDGLMECAAIYQAVSHCAGNRNDMKKLEQRYATMSEKTRENAIFAYMQAEVSPEAAGAKAQFITKGVVARTNKNCRNVSVLFDDLEQCVWKQNNSEAWFKQVMDKVIARTPNTGLSTGSIGRKR